MSKQPHAPVTSSELALLQILWEASRPLNKQEILEKASADEPMFANGGIGRKNARRYAPTVSCNEFLAMQVYSAKSYKPSDIPDILTALLDLTPGIDFEPVLAGIEAVIKKRRLAQG